MQLANAATEWAALVMVTGTTGDIGVRHVL